MTSLKPILCLDFDGVIHSYTTPWRDGDIIPDPPVPGAIEFILKARKYFRVAIFSSRSHMTGGIRAMQEWLQLHMIHSLNLIQGLQLDDIARIVYDEIEWPDYKPAAFLSIDDRAMAFHGIWPDPEGLLSFRPWNKK